MSEQPAPNPGRFLPPFIEGQCPWKESGPDGNRICTLPEGHDGDCDMQAATP